MSIGQVLSTGNGLQTIQYQLLHLQPICSSLINVLYLNQRFRPFSGLLSLLLNVPKSPHGQADRNRWVQISNGFMKLKTSVSPTLGGLCVRLFATLELIRRNQLSSLVQGRPVVYNLTQTSDFKTFWKSASKCFRRTPYRSRVKFRMQKAFTYAKGIYACNSKKDDWLTQQFYNPKLNETVLSESQIILHYGKRKLWYQATSRKTWWYILQVYQTLSRITSYGILPKWDKCMTQLYNMNGHQAPWQIVLIQHKHEISMDFALLLEHQFPKTMSHRCTIYNISE